jgi:cellulose synthase/poly-beta-1,6-N-acetylglucosamine synthase-like glycosyltransferase
MRKAALRTWRIERDENFTPRTSVIVPTYNEANVIRLKLANLDRVDYPKELIETIIVDSGSDDGTLDIVKDFMEGNPERNIELVVENERKGKSAALNFVLERCHGEIVIVTDADCFWPTSILRKTMEFFADPRVGAISGPKLLLNPTDSRATKSEDQYLEYMNRVKLGEAKLGLTPLFEGGFSAYRRAALDSFDPYKTGSDDCGTIIKLAETNYKALFVPEAKFFSTFPMAWKEKLAIKARRANQLVRVFSRYTALLFAGRIKVGKRVIVTDALTYLVLPVLFIVLLVITPFAFVSFPLLMLTLIFFLVPRIGSVLLEMCQSFFVLFYGILSVVSKKNFLKWQQPADRYLLNEEMLSERNLI